MKKEDANYNSVFVVIGMAFLIGMTVLFGFVTLNGGGIFGAIMTLFFAVIAILAGKSSMREISRLNNQIRQLEKSLETPVEDEIKNMLDDNGLSKDQCKETFTTLSQGSGEWLFLGYLYPSLSNALESLESGKLEDAEEYFKDAHRMVSSLSLPDITWKHEDFFEISRKDIPLIHQYDKMTQVLSFSAKACDALYLGDVEKMRELLNEAREIERDKFVIGDVKFFKYLFEFHYFLLKTVVEAYEAETGAVAKLTEKQAKRFTEAKPAETPQVEKATASTEESERELYRGEVRFKIGAISQERVGTLVVTNKRLKLTGKYRLRGTVATVAVKAALRAAGIGEVYEDIPLKEISWLELKKAILGGYYLEFRARGKKFTLYTDAAQHIYNILKQYDSA